jgi:anti-anti-sigma factor
VGGGYDREFSLATAYPARVLLVAAAYFASAKLGLALAYAQGNVTAVWPPTGIALGALVIWGYRFWPGVALGALLANGTTDVPFFTTAGITLGNTLEALTGAALLSRFDFRPSLDRVRDVFVLVVCAAVLSTMVSATIGNTSLLLGGDITGHRFGFFWRLWWLGDLGGNLLVAPVLMLLASRSGWLELVRSRRAEAVALVGLVAGVSVLSLTPRTPLAFLAFPALVVASLRFRQIGAAVASLVVASVAVWITARGGGPFAHGTRDENLLESQLFCGVGALTALLLAAVLSERQRAEDTQRFLAETSRVLVSSLELDRTLDAVARTAVPDHADWCVIFVLDESGDLRPAAMAHADPTSEAVLWELARRGPPDLNGGSAIAHVVRTARSQLVEQGTGFLFPTATRHEQDGPLRDLGFRSAAVVPLRARGRTLGALALVSAGSERPFDEADLGMAEDLANRCALAADNARLYRHEHGVAETLQRSLLPDRLPDIAGMELAARYLPGSSGVDVGGDWYDAIQNADGTVNLVIGDVAGRGVRAAAMMGQLRTGARAYTLEGRSPATILATVNRLAHAAGFRDMATALCVAYEPATGRLRIANAGHLPPLLMSAGGDVRRLEIATSLPLNVEPNTRYTETEHALAPGDTLLLYTDGLVERAHETLAQGLADLERAAAEAPSEVGPLCDHIAENVLAHAARSDDVALLAFQVLPVHGKPLQLRVSAHPDRLADIRRLLRRWLEDAGATEEEVHSVILAAGEACANSVEHAYGPGEAELEVEARLAAGVVTVRVRDFGQWRTPRGEHRGRGLAIMRTVMDEVAVTHGEDGTIAEMTLRLAHAAYERAPEPAGIPPAGPAPGGPTDAATAAAFDSGALHLRRDGDVVIAELDGEIDMTNAKELFGRIAAGLDNRARGVVLDLSTTRYLDSSGLQALFELARRTRFRGQELHVVAPAGSPGRQLLDLFGRQDSMPIHAAVADAMAGFRT